MILSQPPVVAPFDVNGAPNRAWVEWMSWLYMAARLNLGYGTTAERPTNYVPTGGMYFDTTLGQPIWYSGSGWVDATGAAA